MGAFEQTLHVYREASQEHAENPTELKRLRSNYLQKAWADKKCAALTVADESEREAITVQWMEELGAWFRENILESLVRIEGKSRSDYFLELFETNPPKAVEELDTLFKQSRH